jgi:hypothetical protein
VLVVGIDALDVAERTGHRRGRRRAADEPAGIPDLPGVPLAHSLAKSDEARPLIKVGIQNAAAFARPFALPPATPKDRVLALRRAFQETDPAFLAEAEKAKLTLDPATAEELNRMVAEAFALEPALVARLKDILYK